MTNLVAIVDPSVEFSMNTQANVVNLMSPNPAWQPIVNTGIGTGMQFKFSLYGFDVYVSQNLKTIATETIDSRVCANAAANLFFSAAPEASPLVGAVRQPPKVDSEYNKDLQRDEYVTTCRYGLDLYRPENFVVVLADTTVANPADPV